MSICYIWRGAMASCMVSALNTGSSGPGSGPEILLVASCYRNQKPSPGLMSYLACMQTICYLRIPRFRDRSSRSAGFISGTH